MTRELIAEIKAKNPEEFARRRAAVGSDEAAAAIILQQQKHDQDKPFEAVILTKLKEILELAAAAKQRFFAVREEALKAVDLAKQHVPDVEPDLSPLELETEGFALQLAEQQEISDALRHQLQESTKTLSLADAKIEDLTHANDRLRSEIRSLEAALKAAHEAQAAAAEKVQAEKAAPEAKKKTVK